MKKILLTLIVVFVATGAFAQFVGGLKAGANIANLSGDVEGNSSLFAFHFGGYGQFALSETLTLQPELLFYGAGASFDGGDLKASYLAIPVMFKYKVGEMFNIQAGPQLALLLSTDPSEAKDGTKGTDFGLNFGVGANFGAKFSADLRYSLGLSNIYDGPGDGELKNNVIQISLGYQLFGE